MDSQRKMPTRVKDEGKTTDGVINFAFNRGSLISLNDEKIELKQIVPTTSKESLHFKISHQNEMDNLGKSNKMRKLSSIQKYESDYEEEPYLSFDQQIAMGIGPKDCIKVRKGNIIE